MTPLSINEVPHSFNKYLLSFHFIPATRLCSRQTAVKEADKICLFLGISVYWGMIGNLQTNIILGGEMQ